ncbi:potassium channel protein [Antribacter gilvus]|uniref:potassium channel protein n=1 Tax=Antribacter gilvus TaxID=2304675 RepID=UPI0013DE9D40|nr:NAD-binding protein [Antribacter gilvus]
MPTERSTGQRHFVVCGDNPLAYRVSYALSTRYEGTVAVVVPDVTGRYAALMAALRGVELVQSAAPDADALRRAGAGRAEAVALLDQDDGANVDTALLVDEHWPEVRQVVRIFDDDLGASLEQHVERGQAMSSSAFAAPELVAAALGEPMRLHVPDRHLVVAEPGTELPVRQVLFAGHDDEPVRPLPAGRPEQNKDVVRVLASAPPPPPRAATKRRPPRTTLRTIGMVAGRNLRIALLVVVGLIAVAAATIVATTPHDLATALYMAVVTALGGGDPDVDLGAAERATRVVLTIVSVAVIPLVTAALVDGVVRTRLLLDRGVLIEPMSGHVVVVGLGDLGTRVVKTLVDRGVDVVAVDRDEQARGVAVARELTVPVVIGDARQAATLRTAQAGSARAVVVATSGTATTVGIGFAADAVERDAGTDDLRVVLRIFDEGLRERLEAKVPHFSCASASHLAAPRFAAATMGQEVIDTVAYRDRVLLVAGIDVKQGSPLAERAARDLDEPGRLRVLALHTAALDGGGGDKTIDPGRSLRPLRRGDRVYVIATADGLRRIQEQARPGVLA